jgi:hypothetical protein
VKVRGFRIETTEVESALQAFPGIRESVVVASELQPGDKRLVAYIVCAGPAPDTGTLRRHVAATLPEYMVPSLVVALDALPRTPNGKVDRRRLPAAGLVKAKDDREHVAPRNPREQALSEICAGVLKLDRVGIEDSLFDLGADSVHLFQVVARANEAGMALTPRHVLSGRNIAAIIADLDKSDLAASRLTGPRLVPVSRDRHLTQRAWLETVETAEGRGHHP